MIITVCRLLRRTILLHIFVNSITLYLLLKKEKEHHRPKFCSSSTHYMTCNIPVDMPHTSIMVRAFTLLCKLNSYKLSDKVLFDISMSHLDLVHQACPYCGSTSNHSIYSSYTRDMITFEDGSRKEYLVTIPRIKCSCGHTHAVLPDVLIPYGSYSLRFILLVLSEYLIGHLCVEQLCFKYQIVKSTLYGWIHLFLEHYNLLNGILDSIDSLSIFAIDQIYSYVSITKEFYSRFKFSFLQPQHTTSLLDTT